MTVNSDANKAKAQAFYDLMFNECQPREAIERYAGAVYTLHNLHVADGKAVEPVGVRSLFTELL
jgi:predicted SnoaL-like aldol condensation-catalyzing enzyme